MALMKEAGSYSFLRRRPAAMPVHKYSEPEPGSRYTLLRLVPSGRFLALGNDGALAAVRCCGDDAMWTTTAEEGHFAHHSGAWRWERAPRAVAALRVHGASAGAQPVLGCCCVLRSHRQGRRRAC